MDIEITHGPGNAAAKVTLAPGETLTSEGGAMIAMSGDMGIETTTMKKGKGGLLKALKRLIAGESLFLNHFTPGPNGGDVWLSTTLPGDMKVFDLENESLIVQGGSFVACEHDVNIDMNFQGFKNLFSGEGMFWLNMNGRGKVIFNSFGAIYPVEVDGEFIVDTGHIVAFNETLNFTLTKAGKSWISYILGGEGLVCKFQGKGTVWCQSHNPGAFGHALGPMLKPR
jgi:uncharacterized protein (TIGR00266 family)